MVSELLLFSSTHTPPGQPTLPTKGTHYPLRTPTGPSPLRRLLLLLSSTKHTRPVFFYLKLSPFSNHSAPLFWLDFAFSHNQPFLLYCFPTHQQFVLPVASFLFSILDDGTLLFLPSIVVIKDPLPDTTHTHPPTHKGRPCVFFVPFWKFWSDGTRKPGQQEHATTRRQLSPSTRPCLLVSPAGRLACSIAHQAASQRTDLSLSSSQLFARGPLRFSWLLTHPDLTYRTAFCPSFVQTLATSSQFLDPIQIVEYFQPASFSSWTTTTVFGGYRLGQ